MSLDYEDLGEAGVSQSDAASLVTSMMGHGIVTLRIPYLFRTSPHYDLLVRGPANWIRPGAQPLEGLVETDWSTASFAMHWKLTQHNTQIRFLRGEPFCMLTPQRRGELAKFDPRIERLESSSKLRDSFEHWHHQRLLRIAYNRLQRVKAGEGAEASLSFDGDYLRGHTSSGERPVSDHQIRVSLKRFAPEPSPEESAGPSEV